MTIKQWFSAPTPRQFFYISAIYAIGAPILGIFIAEPFMSAMMMFFLLLSLLFTSAYLKDEIPWNYNNSFFIGTIPFFALFMFYLGSPLSYSEVIDNKNQLEQVSGMIPTEASGRRVGKNRSSALVIDGIRLHCRYSDMNDCAKTYVYANQYATVLYKADTTIGNIAYDIRVGNQPIYNFETQRATFKAAQNKERRQWFFMFVLFILPAYWFYKHNKRLTEVMPKMSGAKIAEIKRQQQEVADEGGCAMAIGIFIFFTIALCTGLTSLFHLALHKFAMAAIYLFFCVLSSYVIVVLSKPAKSL